MYDDILYFDDNKIKETMMKQTFLINKGYFDPKSYFPSLNVTSLDDNTFDKKIMGKYFILFFFFFFVYFLLLCRIFMDFFLKIFLFFSYFIFIFNKKTLRYAKSTKFKYWKNRNNL